MANVKTEWGSSTVITATGLASLADAGVFELAAVDNTSNKFLDAKLYLALKLATGSPASDKTIYVYVPVSEDGTNYTDNATGSAGAITLRTPTNLILIGTIACPDSGALTYKKIFNSVAAAIGGPLPRKWGVVIQNRTGLAFDSTGSNFTVTYTGTYGTIV
jgi:hypothetical protein